jgi:hypothetical protein
MHFPVEDEFRISRYLFEEVYGCSVPTESLGNRKKDASFTPDAEMPNYYAEVFPRVFYQQCETKGSEIGSAFVAFRSCRLVVSGTVPVDGAAKAKFDLHMRSDGNGTRLRTWLRTKGAAAGRIASQLGEEKQEDEHTGQPGWHVHPALLPNAVEMILLLTRSGPRALLVR